jgi:hypothetical protein
MNDPAPTPDPTNDPTPEKEPSTFGELRTFIKATVTEAVGALGIKERTKSDAGTPAGPGNLKGEVQAALKEIEDANKEKAEKTSIADRLAALEAKKENVPIERGPLHKFFKWGE